MQKRATMTGRVFYDLNMNSKWDGTPIDAPIANTRIFLVLPGSRRRAGRAGNSPLGSTTTDANGRFAIGFPQQTPGTSMAVVKDLITRDPLLEFKASASGGAPNAEIAIARPVSPQISSTTVGNNIATVKGTGLAGYTATLYCGQVKCGSALIGTGGLFTVPSTFLTSGTTVFTATQMDSAGRESDSVAAGQAVILQPPTVTSVGPEDRTGVIVGRGTVGATISVFFKADSKSAGTTTVAADGTWTVRVLNLPLGNTPFTASARDSAGVSDLVEVGSVVIGSLASPTVASTALVGAKGQVKGIGAPGAVLTLLNAAGSVIGAATAAADGSYTVTTTADLPFGNNSLRIQQSLNGEVSSIIPAGAVNVPPTVSGRGLENKRVYVIGRGKPGTTIKLFVDGATTASGTTTVDTNGDFKVLTTAVLAPGTYSFDVTATDGGVESIKVA